MTRQANYLKFCVDHLVPDPCGEAPSYEFLVAAYTKYLTKGIQIEDISLRKKNVFISFQLMIFFQEGIASTF